MQSNHSLYNLWSNLRLYQVNTLEVASYQAFSDKPVLTFHCSMCSLDLHNYPCSATYLCTLYRVFISHASLYSQFEFVQWGMPVLWLIAYSHGLVLATLMTPYHVQCSMRSLFQNFLNRILSNPFTVQLLGMQLAIVVHNNMYHERYSTLMLF